MPWSSRARKGAARPRWLSVGAPWWMIVSLAAIAWLAAGCGTPTQAALPSLPGGTYTNAQYHLSVTYPAGWQANATPGGSAAIPLTVSITRTGDAQTASALVSNITITVLDAKSPSIAPSIATLATDTSLHKVTIGGLPGYADSPTTQLIQGTTTSDTHTDYYLVVDGFEYQITTDALSNDDAASTIDQILASLKITK